MLELVETRGVFSSVANTTLFVTSRCKKENEMLFLEDRRCTGPRWFQAFCSTGAARDLWNTSKHSYVFACCGICFWAERLAVLLNIQGSVSQKQFWHQNGKIQEEPWESAYRCPLEQCFATSARKSPTASATNPPCLHTEGLRIQQVLEAVAMFHTWDPCSMRRPSSWEAEGIIICGQ